MGSGSKAALASVRCRASSAAWSQACSLASSRASLLPAAAILSRAWTAVIRFMTSLASRGERMPLAQAVRSEHAALTRSPGPAISGRSSSTDRSRRGGSSRPTQKRCAGRSPARALAISVRVISSASPASTASSASVRLLREPFGRPRGLRPELGADSSAPLLGTAPGAGLRSSMILAPLSGLVARRPRAAPQLPAARRTDNALHRRHGLRAALTRSSQPSI